MKKFQIPKGKREYYFVLLLGFILVFIVVSISILFFTQPQQTQTATTTQTPLPTPILQPAIVEQTTPLKYNSEASKTLLHREEQRTPLSTSDAQAKTRILRLLPSGQNYGPVYSSPDIIIQYVQALDLFEVEVLTINVSAAKIEAENWFKQEGMSQQGICDLPLGFYPGGDTANILIESNYVFDELPDGC